MRVMSKDKLQHVKSQMESDIKMRLAVSILECITWSNSADPAKVAKRFRFIQV